MAKSKAKVNGWKIAGLCVLGAGVLAGVGFGSIKLNDYIQTKKAESAETEKTDDKETETTASALGFNCEIDFENGSARVIA